MFDKVRKSRAVVPCFLVAFSLLLPLTACSVDRTYLPALLADPMASYEAEGIELVNALEEREGHDIIMDMPTHADVWRKYRIEDQTRVQALLIEAVSHAEEQGWRIEKESDSEYVGVKELEPGMGRLHLSTPASHVLNDPDGPKGLSIRLDFGSVRFDDTTTSTS